MEDELYRVESAVAATASGNLTWDRWPYDVATALGFAGQHNPLGFAMVRYLDSPSRWTAQEVVLHLATWLTKAGLDGLRANDIAWQAFDFWQDHRCGRCGGRGVIDMTGQLCPSCNGSGSRRYDDKSESLRDGISRLLEAERWLEGQLRARMRPGC